MSSLITQTVSDEVLDKAYRWLCRSRRDYSHNNDVWNLRRNWPEVKKALKSSLLNNRFAFEPLQEIRLETEFIELWSSRDILVLKALSLVLTKHLASQVSGRCFHLRGKGGVGRAVRETISNLKDYRYVMKSDIRGYYASIDHDRLMNILKKMIPDPAILDLCFMCLKRRIVYGGNYRETKTGISLGCPLSPLFGALYLSELDEFCEQNDCFYARFMDDWIILVQSRWKLKQLVCKVNRILNFLKIEKHPDKTFIGRIDRGFDFLGFAITPRGVGIAAESRRRCAARINRLYEQGADLKRIGSYVRRWYNWFKQVLEQITGDSRKSYDYGPDKENFWSRFKLLLHTV